MLIRLSIAGVLGGGGENMLPVRNTKTYSDCFVCFPRHASGRVAHTLSLSLWPVGLVCGPMALRQGLVLATLTLRGSLGCPPLSLWLREISPGLASSSCVSLVTGTPCGYPHPPSHPPLYLSLSLSIYLTALPLPPISLFLHSL